MSTDARFVACADASGQVLLYGFLPHKGAYFKWDLVGKFKAHHSKPGAVEPLVGAISNAWNYCGNGHVHAWAPAGSDMPSWTLSAPTQHL